MISRKQREALRGAVKGGRVAIVYGPRRAGKTTLIQEYVSGFSGKVLVESGDNRLVREMFDVWGSDALIRSFRDVDLLVLDEAQVVPKLGEGLKRIVDQLPELKVIASGSSSFEIARQVGEPLTGRKRVLTLFPISAEELIQDWGLFEVKRRLGEFLVYGMYPEVLEAETETEKRRYLRDLTEDYLFKDILAFEGLRNSDKIRRLLSLLSYQVGKEVSVSELGTQLSMSKQLVERFLDLLEKTFVIWRVGGFSRNLRTEVAKSSRYYFVDNGVLCALQNNHSKVETRGDVGALWENWLAMERIKYNHYHETFMKEFFWRTYARQEIDFVETGDGIVRAFEFKWGTKMPKPPSAWVQAYPEASFEVVNPQNFEMFVS